MLLKLSIKNIKRSFKDYTIYFLTLILGIAVFYVFNAIESQTVMMNVSSSTKEIMKMMVNILSGVSVFVSMILAFLIIYASRFLMKRRHKEFAIYMTLGMSKQQISMIILCETFLIGLFSLGIGLFLGIALSQLMSMLVASMFNVDMTRFEFVYSSSATFKTILYFAFIYMLVMIFHVYMVGKQRLMTLLNNSRQSEVIKTKNLWLCSVIFIVAAGMLGYAYYLVTGGVHSLDTADKILLPIALGIVSTFMIFYSISGFVLKFAMMDKQHYFKDLNAFVLRQISSQMNTMVMSMSIICLMLFMTICVLASSLSLKEASVANLDKYAPVDLYLEKNWDLSGQSYSKQEIAYSHQDIESLFQEFGINASQEFQNYFSINQYATNDLLVEDTFGSYVVQAKKQYPFLKLDSAELIMTISDYNKVAKMYGNQTYSLKDNEYMIVANYENMASLRNEALKRKEPIHLLGKTYVPKWSECQDGFVTLSSNKGNSGIVIVPDHAVNDSIRQRNIFIGNYRVQDRKDKEKTEKRIIETLDKEKATHIEGMSKIILEESSIGIGAMVTFIGIYLGIVFMISSAAILALKQLSDSADNKERYQMLRKIGVEEKMLNHAIFKQVLIFFIAPLTLAIIHSIFGITFTSIILENFGNENLLESTLMTALFIVLIYGGYFMMTYASSCQMIKEKMH